VFDQPAVVSVRSFLETGGDVLYLIGGVLLVMWTLMLERFWYFWKVHPQMVDAVREEWKGRRDRSSWYAHQIRRLLISQVNDKLQEGLPMIRTLVALCPLLGLLGTVTGMIEVFDVMAVAGSGNARAMASGVSKATVPTMAGMVAALSGLMLSVQIDKFTKNEEHRLADSLTLESR
jgi:biopolymer transport protein ExbB